MAQPIAATPARTVAARAMRLSCRLIATIWFMVRTSLRFLAIGGAWLRNQNSATPVAPPSSWLSHQTVVAGDHNRGGCLSAHLFRCRFLLCAPCGCRLHRDESPRPHLHQLGPFASGDESVEERLAHAAVHAAKFWD